MRFHAAVFAVSLLLPSALQAQVVQPEDISRKSTHEQVALIKATEGEASLKLNTFCLDKAGNIFAGCNAGLNKDGSGKGVIRVLDPNGKLLRSWKTTVDPEAVNTTPEGNLMVGGDGKLFLYNSEGKQLLEAKAPHAEHLKGNAEEVRKQVVQQLENRSKLYDSSITTYEARIATLKKKEEPTDTEKKLLAAYTRSLESLKQARKRMADQPKPSKEQIDQQVAQMIKMKTGISSLSTDGKHVFVATRALKGYGFAVWRTNTSFAEAKQIVNGLSGCCGQMDVQVGGNGLFVAENSRHRVVNYDADGKEITKWGKADRKGVEGFSSCCNPMNVCFGKNGDVYTSESNTGRIKRYSPKGELLDYVGDVKLVPGCKKVSIAVADKGNRVYMLDITRNHIIVMERKSSDPKDGAKAEKTAADTDSSQK